MFDEFPSLTDADLRTLAIGLRDKRLAPPFNSLAVGRCIGPSSNGVLSRLNELTERGHSPEQISLILEALAAGRSSRHSPIDSVEMVWTGPQAADADLRDTAVVVRELFAQANQSVLVSGYRVYQGRHVFRPLGDRMSAVPGMNVRLYLDVHRERGDAAPQVEILRRFARRFVEMDWPERSPLPEVYFDPRSLVNEGGKRSSLHAKCVVIDRKVALITSANFTEAAHERNIETGVVIRSERFATRVADHFEALAAAQVLLRLEILG